MGNARKIDLFPTELLPETNEAREIGALPQRRPATACLIENQLENMPVFRREVPMRVGWVPKEERLQGSVRARWWRLEGKIDCGPADCAEICERDHFLVVAEHPYHSTQRVHWAKFKRGLHKGREERPDLAGKPSLPELLQAIENLEVDYWETGSRMTAGWSEPEQTLRDDKGRNWRDALYVFGICDLGKSKCFDDLVTTLFDSETGKTLRQQTEDRTIQFTPKWAPPVRLYDEVAKNGPGLLLLAIRQALAGPHKDSETFFGRPVMNLAARIYRELLNNANRRMARLVKKERPLQFDPQD